MLPFLLHSSIGLVGAGIFSALLVGTPGIRNRIRRKSSFLYSEEYNEQEDQPELLESIKDPFDIIRPQDVSDGDPVDERQFWRKVNLRKATLLVVLSMIVVDHSVSVSYSLMAHPLSPFSSVLPPLLHLAFMTHLVRLTVLSLGAHTVEKHWPAMVHVASLSSLSAIAQCISILVPNDVPGEEDDKYIFWWISLALTAIAAAISGTTPLGPQLYFPPEQVYTLKSIKTITNPHEEVPNSDREAPPNRFANVSGLVSASCAGTLLFDYTTSVVMLGYTSLSPEIADLPILPSTLRATAIFYNMRRLLRSAPTRGIPQGAFESPKWATYRFTVRVPFGVALAQRFPTLQARFPFITQSHTIAPFSPFSRPINRPPWVTLALELGKANRNAILTSMALCVGSVLAVYTPPFFLRKLMVWLENDPGRSGGRVGIIAWQTIPASDTLLLGSQAQGWAWVYCAGIFGATGVLHLLNAQLWSISTTVLQLRLKTQLNTTLFAKTLVKKSITSVPANQQDKETKGGNESKKANDNESNTTISDETTGIVTAAASSPAPEAGSTVDIATAVDQTSGTYPGGKELQAPEEEFSSKAQIMTLMTTDVDRVASLSWHFFGLVACPTEILIGGYFLWTLLGTSAFVGLGASLFVMPISHWATKIIAKAQDDLMSARDERAALMNEILGGIRTLKFMAWERMFEKRILKIRDRELSHQWRNYVIETLLTLTWRLSPVLVSVVAFWHYAVIRKLPLTPSVAFTSLILFGEIRYALGYLPEIFVNLLQSVVSLRRISKYLDTREVSYVGPLNEQDATIAMNSATIGWPQESVSNGIPNQETLVHPESNLATRGKFILQDLTLDFPRGELSLICGKLGSGKTLLLLALLGEAEILTGQVLCPRSPPDAVAALMHISSDDDWVLPGMCAYVPQISWLQNASIKDNILFNLPLDEERYQQTLEACALAPDIVILEDGDESEIGERGVNLSGGQKARISLARAVYSRASTLLLDDVLSAVDAHTAQHLYEKCLCGPLLKGRTVILVSHHIQLCAPQAKYVVALERGKLRYQGSSEQFLSSPTIETLIQSKHATSNVGTEEAIKSVEDAAEDLEQAKPTGLTVAERTTMTVGADGIIQKLKVPKKLIEDETREVGRIRKDVWAVYLTSAGGALYWVIMGLALILASLDPVAENGWIKIWSGAVNHGDTSRSPLSYILIYALIAACGLVVFTLQFFVLYRGSVHASNVLHKKLLKAILFAPIRFHDTTNRGRLLNRFGKDLEGIDSSLADNLGHSLVNMCTLVVTISTVAFVGGWPFLLASCILALFFIEIVRVYGQTARNVQRLDSVSRSPLYSIYGDAITGVAIVRAFGSSSKFMRDMLRCVDTNSSPSYWNWGIARWMAIRFRLLSTIIIGITAVIVVRDKNIDASYAGLAMTFIIGLTDHTVSVVLRLVKLEQSMVAVERVKEFSEITQEPPEFIEPRPPASWPSSGAIEVKHLSVRYAPDLPNVLHDLNFQIGSGQKVGVLGRTGGGKSTLTLSFFRFVEVFEGEIFIDGLDISQIGLTDLRSRLTIIPQDPTILSGTLRSTLDIFEEYEDAEIYEALRRVHLLQPNDEVDIAVLEGVHDNVFRNLDSPVSEGGENFSAGEKQLICMARAILKRTKIIFMDEATASVDYATDELIGKTIRHEFKESTILTIAHRIRTIIDYDIVMVLDKGRIVEFDKPSTLLADRKSQFYSLCKATGPEEFSVLMKLSNGSKAS